MPSAANPYRDQRTQYDPGMGMDELCDALNLGLYIGVNATSGASPTISSAIISFLQSGSATPRTAESRFQDTVHVTDHFTAAQIANLRTGTLFDATSAIQAAIDSIPTTAGGNLPTAPSTTRIGGYALYFPRGVYQISSKLVIGSRRMMFLGNGMIGSAGTTIYCADADVDFIDYYTGSLDVFSLYGIQFYGAGKGTGTGNAIRLGNSGQTYFDSQIQRCWFVNIPNACIYADYASDLSVQSCGLEGSKYGVYVANSGIATGDINKIQNNTFYGLTYGIYATGGTDLQITGNQISFCGTDPGGTMDNTSGGIVLINGASPSVRATLIGTNTFRSNVTDIIVDGSAGSAIGSDTGVLETNVTGNTSDRAYRRFILVDDADGTKINGNKISTPNTEGGAFDAVDITGTSDGTVIDGNEVTSVAGVGEPRYGLSLGASTVNTTLGPNKFAGSSGAVNINASATLTDESSYVQTGTWTPAVGGNATYTLQEGIYRKQGKQVFIKGKIVINALGTGSTTTISGLPFTSDNAANASVASGSVSYFSGLAANVTFINPVVVNNSATMTFTTIGAAGATASNATAVFADSARIDFCATYLAAQ